MEKKKQEIKEIRIYLTEEMKEWLQELAKEQNKPLRTFIVDSLTLMYETAYLEKEMLKLKKENEAFLSHIKSIKVN